MRSLANLAVLSEIANISVEEFSVVHLKGSSIEKHRCYSGKFPHRKVVSWNVNFAI